MMLSARDTGRAAGYAVWIDGKQVLGGMHDRLRMARDMFGAGPGAPVALAVTVAQGEPGAEARLKDFLAAQHHGFYRLFSSAGGAGAASP
jgi:hypothetical protein